jgi:ribosomal protein L31
MIGPISFQYGPLGNYTAGNVSMVNPVSAVDKVANINPVGSDNISVSETRPAECQTCKGRKYVDASNDGNVSFQTPTHVSPESSHAMVSAHEQEHVTKAYSTASQKEGRVVYASVSLKMSVCPECHTPYVAGGVTRSQIKYDISNPYEGSRKSLEGSVLTGMRVDRKA